MDKKHNEFGGYWTEQKILIFTKYLYAYLEIMKKRPFPLIYFDGFAGCGTIKKSKENSGDLLESVALEVIGLNHPHKFTYYYLVEKNKRKSEELREKISLKFGEVPGLHIVDSDCNLKMKAMSKYLLEHPNFRALCFIDPFGMTLDWESISCFKDLGVDMWLLVPTGIGVNRLLTKSGDISESWLKKLELFLGIDRQVIHERFYNQTKTLTLFGEESDTHKIENAIDHIMTLYSNQLKSVFKFVSSPFPMKNTLGSTMYHFVLATNNRNGLKIGDDIIGKQLKEIKE